MEGVVKLTDRTTLKRRGGGYGGGAGSGGGGVGIKGGGSEWYLIAEYQWKWNMIECSNITSSRVFLFLLKTKSLQAFFLFSLLVNLLLFFSFFYYMHLIERSARGPFFFSAARVPFCLMEMNV